MSTTKSISKSILAFVKPLVSKTVYNALNLLLCPCYAVYVKETTIDCVSTGIYDITLDLGNVTIETIVNISIGNVYNLTVYPEGVPIINGIAKFTNVDLSTIGGADTYNVQIITSYIVNSNEYRASAVVKIPMPYQVTFPAC